MDGFNRLLDRLNNIPSAITKDLLRLYKHCTIVQTCENRCSYSEDTKLYLINNLIANPFPVGDVLHELDEVYKSKHEGMLHDVFMAALLDHELDAPSLYSLLSQARLCREENANLLSSQLHEMMTSGKLERELVYMSLVTQDDLRALRHLLSYEKEGISDNLVSMCRYVFRENRHWLYYIVENDVEDSVLNTDKLNIVKLIYLTNCEPFETEKIKKCISNITLNKIEGKFLKFIVLEVRRSLHILESLTEISEADHKTLFDHLSNNSCLQTLSEYTDLTDPNHWAKIRKILLIDESHSAGMLEFLEADDRTDEPSEYDVFNGFSLLLTVMNHIKTSRELDASSREMLNTSKKAVLQSNNVQFQLEVFEKVFDLMFLKSLPDTPDSSYVCGSKEVHYITSLLKSCLNEIKLKHFSGTADEDPVASCRLGTLVKRVSDTLWRLEFLKGRDIDEFVDSVGFMNLMLWPPESYIYLCLEDENFERVHEIIEVFDMQESQIAQEIDHMERFEYLKLQKPPDATDQHNTSIIKFCRENQDGCSSAEDEADTNIFDTALTYVTDYSTSRQFLAAARFEPDDESCVAKFHRRMSEVLDVLGPDSGVSVPEILNTAEYSLDVSELRTRNEFFERLTSAYDEFVDSLADDGSALDLKHRSIGCFLRLAEACKTEDTEHNLLLMLHNYLVKFAEVLLIRRDDGCALVGGGSVFSLLHTNKAALVGRLLFERGVRPKELEFLFIRLKLDLVYHIAWNCLPDVDLCVPRDETQPLTLEHTSFADYISKLSDLYCSEPAPKLRAPDTSLLEYIRKRNWLLAYLINKIHCVEEAKPDTNSDRTQFFNNLLNLPRIQHLKVLYDNNTTVTALNHDIGLPVLLRHLQHCAKHRNYDQNSEKGVQNLLDVFHIIDSFPETSLAENAQLKQLRDFVLYKLASGVTSSCCKYVEFISDDDLRIECILKNVHNWPGNFCVDMLKSQSSYVGINANIREDLDKLCTKIELYEDLCKMFGMASWNEVDIKSNCNPREIFFLLLDSKQLNNLLKWIELNKVCSVNLLKLIDADFFAAVLSEDVDLSNVQILLNMLSFTSSVNICKNLLRQVCKVEHISFLVKYLVSVQPELESQYRNVTTSVLIMSCFKTTEHQHMICLIEHPLLIIEQLIMNSRLERLAMVLEKIQPALTVDSSSNVTVQHVDNLLRIYAKKALDFRGIQPMGVAKPVELKLMQSLDTVSDDSDKKLFVMPDAVPDKKDWVQNDQATECMCCRYVIFSMFNRRHHCRRCGRVVCGNCSTKHMEVPNYGDIPVRVCDDCYRQSSDTHSVSTKGEQTSSVSGSGGYWLLTNDQLHNDIVRDEFSYEYAPSVSLCLSILKLHSDTIEYPRFLLSQCKSLLPMLQSALNEIDYSFIIQMIKTLVTVAKMISLNHSYKSERTSCDEILLQVELLHLLAERECLKYLPNAEMITADDYIQPAVLWRLRDKLLEQEQWSVALDMSMKAGLDSTGVFAAWGKSCLKAGCFQLAREKFQHCLEKNLVPDASLDEDDSTSRSSVFTENRVTKTPLLVNEIVHVLETNGCYIEKNLIMSNQMAGVLNDRAVCVLNKLKNLNNIANGVYESAQMKKNLRDKCTKYLDPCHYNECLYYLLKYGSHTSILHFYIKYYEFDRALKYIHENQVQPDIFIEIYVSCLRDNKVELLQNELQKVDPTLNTWEFYLKSLCRYFEKNEMFNVLYNLQVFMCDYVRAAMTSIRFYQENINNFTELLNREEYLITAQLHLKQELEQEQWVQVSLASVRKMSTASSEGSQDRITGGSLTMKVNPRSIDRYINTIWRQIEVTKLLAKCESENRPTLEILDEVFVYVEDDKKVEKETKKIPTLFDTQLEKNQLAVLVLVCGTNITEGFGIAFRIIQDYHLKYLKIYCLAAKYLSKTMQDAAVEELISCIRSSGLNEQEVSEACDEVLSVTVRTLFKVNANGSLLEKFIKMINNVGTKINAYIESGQLKCAYLLAVRHNRNNDIKKILREAEKSNQAQIKAICIKRLNQTHS